MNNLVKITLGVTATIISGLALGWGTPVYYSTPDPYYPVYYSVDRYTGTHYVREPYYAREPYYRTRAATYWRHPVVYRPVVWVPSHTSRCCYQPGYWQEAPHMSSGGTVWVPAYYSGRRHGYVQGHWVMPD